MNMDAQKIIGLLANKIGGLEVDNVILKAKVIELEEEINKLKKSEEN